MKSIWQSDLRRDLKINLFQATAESILLYGSETWTMTESLKRRLMDATHECCGWFWTATALEST